MDPYQLSFEERQRLRGMRENAHLWIRHDAYRFMPPGSPFYSGRDVVKYFEPNFGAPSEDELRRERAEDWAGLLSLKADLAELKAEIERERRKQELESKRLSDLRWRRFVQKAHVIFDERQSKAGFNPGQPRVPSGDPDGGQWTSEGGVDDPRVISDGSGGIFPSSNSEDDKMILAARRGGAFRRVCGIYQSVNLCRVTVQARSTVKFRANSKVSRFLT